MYCRHHISILDITEIAYVTIKVKLYYFKFFISLIAREFQIE